ncbi:hypothetical protein IG193_00735 [Infirmifilum lucidum]|uniref:Uncharacterized protein n=1 Tax=Infirmifilum lucidum TaxID=2776706 RepID=A0A7L9FH28_9CREN|nr:hypothetical protein [Infirmifilum lucidum]QOJ79027.1 hypothetical protein IG193_00735 [Infirmifilum lucidum]
MQSSEIGRIQPRELRVKVPAAILVGENISFYSYQYSLVVHLIDTLKTVAVYYNTGIRTSEKLSLMCNLASKPRGKYVYFRLRAVENTWSVVLEENGTILECQAEEPIYEDELERKYFQKGSEKSVLTASDVKKLLHGVVEDEVLKLLNYSPAWVLERSNCHQTTVLKIHSGRIRVYLAV